MSELLLVSYDHGKSEWVSCCWAYDHGKSEWVSVVGIMHTIMVRVSEWVIVGIIRSW